MDLFDLKLFGWSYGLNMTDDLVVEAFKKAEINRGLNKYFAQIVVANIHLMILNNY